MKTLLDTCVLSELRRSDCNEHVRQAIAALASEDLFVSVISLGEIVKGVSLLAAGRRQQELLNWINTLEQNYASRILSIELDVVHIWGEITATAQKRGLTISAADGLIAATALCHGLHLMTRNVDDFEPTGALLINPWN